MFGTTAYVSQVYRDLIWIQLPSEKRGSYEAYLMGKTVSVPTSFPKVQVHERFHWDKKSKPCTIEDFLVSITVHFINIFNVPICIHALGCNKWNY